MRTLATCAALVFAIGCDEPEAPISTLDTPPSAAVESSAAIEWPATPAGVSDDVQRCITDYRTLAADGLPARPDAVAFPDWYRGAFQTWTDRYNAIRLRCDEVFSAMDQTGAAAQVLLATQSHLHQRLAEQATPMEEEPQMFVMATYWRLGAACTYQSCERGPDPTWASLCERRARPLPPCPPIDEDAPR